MMETKDKDENTIIRQRIKMRTYGASEWICTTSSLFLLSDVRILNAASTDALNSICPLGSLISSGLKNSWIDILLLCLSVRHQFCFREDCHSPFSIS